MAAAVANAVMVRRMKKPPVKRALTSCRELLDV